MGSAARALRPTLQQIEKTSMSIKMIHSRTPYTPLTLLAARRDDQRDAAMRTQAKHARYDDPAYLRYIAR